MKIRFFDKPVEMFATIPGVWKNFKDGEWEATQKVDGYQTFIVKDPLKAIKPHTAPPNGVNKDLYFMSRRDIVKGGPTAIPANNEIIKTFDDLNLPPNTFICGEWMKIRTIGELPEKLFLLDLLWFDDVWFGCKQYWERKAKLVEIFRGRTNDHVAFPDVVISGYQEFFEAQKKIPWTEGVVLKKLNSTAIGDCNGCEKNPMVVKIKWRSGSSGRDIVI